MYDSWHEIKNITHFIIIFECLLLAVFLTGYKYRNLISSKLLFYFLLSIAIASAGGVFIHFIALRDTIFTYFPWVYYLPFPFRYLYAPVLFLYVLSVIKTGYTIKPKQLVHFIPFVYFVIRSVVQIILHDNSLIREMLNSTGYFTQFETTVYVVIEYLQFFGYVFYCIYLLNEYNKAVKDQFSSTENILLKWLQFILWGFVIWKSLKLLFVFSTIVNSQTILIIGIYILSQLLFISLLGFITVKALRKNSFLVGINGNGQKKKYERNLLPESLKETYKNRIIDYMESKKPYLDDSLNLQKLSKMVDIPTYHISQILNTQLHLSFYDFINYYRVLESQKMLKESTSNKKTILEILYDCGYNSKSAFNTAFKKHTGITPTEFRNG